MQKAINHTFFEAFNDCPTYYIKKKVYNSKFEKILPEDFAYLINNPHVFTTEEKTYKILDEMIARNISNNDVPDQ